MEYRTRKMVMPRDLNGGGNLFGGRAMEWIDEEAAIFAHCQLQHPNSVVTKLISEINFEAPARLNDIVEIGTEVVKIGTTSITVRCFIRNKTTKQNIVTVDKIVFVNVDENGKPTPHNVKQYDLSTVKLLSTEPEMLESPGVSIWES